MVAASGGREAPQALGGWGGNVRDALLAHDTPVATLAGPILEKLEQAYAELPFGIEPPGLTRQELVVSLLALYLLDGDLLSARGLIKRTTVASDAGAEFTALAKVVKALFNNDSREAFRRLNAGPGGGGDAEWSPIVGNLIRNKISPAVRERYCRLLANAYTAISVSDAAGRLGLTQEQAIEVSKSRGWTHDAQAGMLLSAPIESPRNNAAGIDQFQHLVDTVLHLERGP